MTTLRSKDRRKDSREDEVRKLLEAGMTVRQIARRLDMSTQGVYWHLHRINAAS